MDRFVNEMVQALKAIGMDAKRDEEGRLKIRGCEPIGVIPGRTEGSVRFLGRDYKRTKRGYNVTRALGLLVQALPAMLRRGRLLFVREAERRAACITAYTSVDGVSLTVEHRDPHVLRIAMDMMEEAGVFDAEMRAE